MTIIRAGLGFFGRTGSPVRDVALRIGDNGRISDLGRVDEVTPELAESVFEFPDGSVLPGLVNAHDHLRLSEPDPEPTNLDVVAVALTAGYAARRHVDRGVTTVRVLGTVDRIDLSVKDAISRGLVDGPRLQCAGRGLIGPGVSTAVAPVSVSDMKSALSAAEIEIQAGVDVIKLYSSRGVAAAIDGGTLDDSLLDDATIEAVVALAHSAGIRVAAHAHGSKAIEVVVDAGVDTLEHGIGLQPNHARQMAEQGIVYVPTFTTYSRIAKLGLAWGLPRAWVETAAEATSIHAVSVRNALDGGVVVATGTDSYGDFGEEVESLSALGMGDAVLAASTLNGARALGLDDVGTLEQGKRADVIVVDGDPRESLGALRQIRLVVIGGKLRRKVARGGHSSTGE